MSARSEKSESVRVVVRCRPLSEKEIADGHRSIVDIYPDKGLIEIRDPSAASSDPPRAYTFDAVYDGNAKQMDLYDESFRPLVDSVMEGFNGTIFAYGQTGTGKTYTMEGNRADAETRGVIPNSFQHIFSHIARSQNRQYLVRASYLEIYQEEIRDLIAKDQNNKLELKERPDTGVYVKDLSSYVCKSIKEIEHCMTVGNRNRAVGQTNMNLHSSRSHAIFIITVEHSDVDCGDNGHGRLTSNSNGHIRVGKLNMVDLAGSERQVKTGAVGNRQKEAIKINLSLSALGNVISALVDGKSFHVPYRDSKLTRLLQDSLGGNAKTVMIANIGPASYNYEETLTTLRYANRAKSIKNKPKVNEDPKDALLRQFQQEIARLKAELAVRMEGGNVSLNRRQSGKKKRQPRDSAISTSSSEDSGATLGYLDNENALLDEQLMRDDLASELNQRKELASKEQEAAQQLASRVRAMESKLLSGGENIVDHTNEQQRALEQRRQEIAEQRRREREMLQKLEDQEGTAVEIRDTFTSLQQEVEVKTKKLRKLYAKLQAIKKEMDDVEEEHSRERRNLDETQNELTKELKLKYLIVENLIPTEERMKLLQRAVFDEDADVWHLVPLAVFAAKNERPGSATKRPLSSVVNRRPTSQYARTSASLCPPDLAIRFKSENIFQVELDMPEVTTKDYDAPRLPAEIRFALDELLKPEDDIDVDASILSAETASPTRHSKTRPRVQSSTQELNDTLAKFPEPRGLVSKTKHPKIQS